jgi:cell wall-associated NlpC family hydrolase
MHRRAIAFACVLAAFAPAATAHAANNLGNWDLPQQRNVAQAGVLPDLPGGFHGEQSLTADQLRGALAAIAQRNKVAAVDVPDTRISVRLFHKLVVKQLGLADLANSIQAEARGAGLKPPSVFGNEVVARQLGLRYDHPSQDDALELYPTDTITRAEAAYSFDHVLSRGTGSAYYARQLFAGFKLPAYTPDQLRVLRIAVSKIGMPYVWGGETDTASTTYGPQAHGGYDCSGFVWRVFKLSGDPAGQNIKGRTAAQMAGEIAQSDRVPFDSIAPGDLLFFGASFDSRSSANVSHVGIALSGEFMIHSSSQGVYVSSLTESWRRSSFAWARRVL